MPVKIQLFRNQLANQKIMVGALLGLCVMLGLAVSSLTYALLNDKQILHVLPVSVKKDYWASSLEADDEYVKSVALSLLPFVTNVTPANVVLHHAQFLKYVASDAYGTIAANLKADEQFVKKHNLNRAFFVDRIVMTGQVVTLMGTEKRWVGHNAVKTDRRGYAVELRIESWQPRVVSLTAGPLSADGQRLEAT